MRASCFDDLYQTANVDIEAYPMNNAKKRGTKLLHIRDKKVKGAETRGSNKTTKICITKSTYIIFLNGNLFHSVLSSLCNNKEQKNAIQSNVYELNGLIRTVSFKKKIPIIRYKLLSFPLRRRIRKSIIKRINIKADCIKIFFTIYNTYQFLKKPIFASISLR
jgi:hypothetical protein